MLKIIALLLVMVIVNLFMIFTIIKAYEKTEETVVSYFVKKTSEIENRIDTTVDQENIVEVPVWYELEKVVFEKQPTPVLPDKDEVKSIKYKLKDISKDYKYIKANMAFDKAKVLDDLIRETCDEPIDERVFLAAEVLNKLSFSKVYDLGGQDPEEQEIAIGNMLDENEEALIDMYIESERPVEFSAINFYSFLKQYLDVNGTGYSVSTGWKDDDFSSLGDDVDTVFDDSITEGIKVIHGNKLYDYSI